MTTTSRAPLLLIALFAMACAPLAPRTTASVASHRVEAETPAWIASEAAPVYQQVQPLTTSTGVVGPRSHRARSPAAPTRQRASTESTATRRRGDTASDEEAWQRGLLAAGGVLVLTGATLHLAAEGESERAPRRSRRASQKKLKRAGDVSLGLGGAALLTGVLWMAAGSR